MKTLLLAALVGAVAMQAGAEDSPSTMAQPVVEIVMFKVSDPVEGLAAARAIVDDARAFSGAVLSADLYQSASDPSVIAQHITWRSLDDAKAAFAASEGFPNMKRAMAVMTEQILFEYFHPR